MLDTFVTITLYGSREAEVLDGAFDIVRRFDHMMNRHHPGSDLWALNHAQGRPVELPHHLARLIETSLEYAEQAGGSYDPTIAPVIDLWFGERGIQEAEADRVPPGPEEIARALGAVDFRNVQISANTARLLNGAMIDLGSIAKGYIADEVGRYLRGQGVPGAIINLGGDILTIGERPDGRPFQIGIRKPFEEEWTVLGSVQARDLAVVTSGVYERYFVHQGVRYHHILDAQTGFPVDNGLAAVTVISPLAVEGDALSIICFLLGTEEGIAFIERFDGAEALFIQTDGEVAMSAGFQEIFTFS